MNKDARPTVVAICGGSGAGKTTLARWLSQKLPADSCEIISQDHYYRDQSAQLVSGGPRAVNFDHPDSIDFRLMAEHVSTLVRGDTVGIPVYDFTTHQRLPHTQELHPRRIFLIEGILILSEPALREVFDFSVFLEVSEPTRLARRVYRDTRERGRDADDVRAQFQQQVKPMHDRFVEPSKAHADCVFPEDDSIESCGAQILTWLDRHRR